MTKTKKIICIALALLMIAGAVFFAIYNKVGKKYDYGKIKDYSKYITIGNLEGLSFDVDDSAISAPTANDVRKKIGTTMRGYLTDADKKVTTGVIGDYDAVYVNYYGTYEDENGNVVFFVDGAMMDKTSPVAFYVNSGTDSKLFGGETYDGQPAIGTLKGLSPNPDAYVLKATGETAEADAEGEAEGEAAAEADPNAAIDADDVVYITYTWVRYPYDYALDGDGNMARVQDENGKDKVKEDAKQTNTDVDKDVKHVTTEFRLDLANAPDYFPAAFAAELVGKTVGSQTVTLENVNVDGVDYRYVYTVEILRVVDPAVLANFVALSYTYAPDATDKDVYGNELKGKTVTFYVSIASFDNAPDFTAVYPVSSGSEETDSILFVDDKINFDATTFFTENAKSETDWLAENEGRTHDDYIAYVALLYADYVLEGLTDTYNQNRLEKAAGPMWEKIKAQVSAVSYPKKALKLAKEDMLSWFKYVFSNSTFTNSEGKEVSYRTEYGSFKKFMAACYKNESICKQLGLDQNAAYQKAITDGKSYGECLDAAAREIVENKLIIYALYDRFGDDVKVDESKFESTRSMMYMYYYYGLTSTLLPDSALREGMMFDNVMQYIYDHANVQWATAAE